MTSSVRPGLISYQPSVRQPSLVADATTSQIVSEVVFVNFKPAHAGEWIPKKPAANAVAIIMLRTIVLLLVVNLTPVSGEEYDSRERWGRVLLGPQLALTRGNAEGTREPDKRIGNSSPTGPAW